MKFRINHYARGLGDNRSFWVEAVGTKTDGHIHYLFRDGFVRKECGDGGYYTNLNDVYEAIEEYEKREGVMLQYIPRRSAQVEVTKADPKMKVKRTITTITETEYV